MNQTYFRDTIAEIDLDAITHNVQQFRNRFPSSVKLMAVVKADAYGHGAVPVAKTALEAGATHLAVAFLDEALELRNAGIEAPILVLGYTPPAAVAEAVRRDVTLTVYTEEVVDEVASQAARLGHKVPVHVKVDTGMGRLGLFEDEVLPFLHRIGRYDSIEVEGLFTHFATADEMDKSYTKWQHEQLERIIVRLQSEGIKIPLVHCANSATAIDLPAYAHQLVRLGISMYGYYPSAEVNREAVDLRPALTLKTKIVHLKRPPAGMGVSYGKTFVSDGTRWIATIPVGYADGFNRLLSNRGEALVNGRRVPIVGRICMDQTMLDVTEAMPVKVGDEVVLYGMQGKERITVDEVAEALGTISYEVTCMIGYRVPRVYKKGGRIIGVVNRLGQANF
ncbi:alanine racemase [Polycladomyces subterraneus]|uniref:Alanine racemase n=1 Tax=Polycladomyces subterraneus TaxID=1016997 RepID=A0ABT8IPD2_9BACL|nr:alanine racemase [Polycladomyces subterraneus]MDN4594610.1 alanine racemase [Polycladomyces subterraneus]